MKKSVSSRPPMMPSVHGSSSINSISSRVGTACKIDNSHASEVDENTFLENFEQVPPVQIYSVRDIENNMKKCHSILENKNEDWETRVECLKKIRAIVIAGGLKYEEFYENLVKLQHVFQAAVDDLRSVVVREACITVAFLSKNLEHKLERFCETVLPNLINLVQKTSKIFVSSGTVCIRFIIEYTHGSRLIPIITNNMNSKSNLVRRACCEFVYLILKTWPTSTIKRHVVNFSNSLKKGITDGDKDARSYSRDAFIEFTNRFPDHAEKLKKSLDINYRKQLQCSPINESHSLISKHAADFATSMRSNSAIDCHAAKKAHARAEGATVVHKTLGAVGSATKLKSTTPLFITIAAAESRSKRSNDYGFLSQPSSRSESPTFCSYSHNTNSQEENASAILNKYVIELSEVSDRIPEKREVLLKLTKFIQECPSDALITNFRPLFMSVISLMDSINPASIKQITLNLLQTIVQRKTVNFLMKEFSELILTRVITLYTDSAQEVVSAAESCALVLSTNLPVEQVVKIILPLIIPSETTPIKLIAIKMLTALFEYSDSTELLKSINKIMSVLLIVYDDVSPVVRRAAVYCIVALYKHSEQAKNEVVPYIERLPNAKQKLLELYIHKEL